jgi:Sulfotransferase domain
MTRKPTFINIGTGRCATSWLFEVLTNHPQVMMAAVKETEFFNTNFRRGVDWYQRHFKDGPQLAFGEISTNYYLDAQVAQRIYDYDPNIKIMINVRRPVDLLRSYYQFGVRRGVEMKDCSSALSQPIGPIMGSGYEYRRARKELTPSDTCSLLESVCLADRLRPFLQRFPAEQVYVLIYERIRQNSNQVLAEIYDFIGVDSSFRPTMADQVVNPALTPKSKMIARLATRASFTLRHLGLYSVLHSLKESQTVKRLLYSDKKAKDQQQDVLKSIPEDVLARLQSQERELAAMIPALNPWWLEKASQPHGFQSSPA